MTPQERGSELITEIATRIVHDEEYLAIDWASLALVVSITGSRRSMEGFAYLEDGSAVPALPEDLGIGDLFDELNAVTARPDGGRWLAALVQITRADGHVHLEFDWTDADRWAVTPANLDSRREELRPVAG
jgi:hypothetical protein